jgi:hypothetical protein
MVVRVVTPDFKVEKPPGDPELIAMFKDLTKMAENGLITSAAVAFTNDQGGGGAFGPLTASAALATSLMGALANLQFQMHIASHAEHNVSG